MKVEPSGVVMWGTCSIQTEKCTANTETGAPITAVWEVPARRQVDVCRACLAEQQETKEWQVVGAGEPMARTA